uniref:TIR domain-containing protein n=1 Tax=Medicago truncatula TaxID=3880 RepID=I3SIL3_MEDTR|nr:unknown [Medicago truncatula]
MAMQSLSSSSTSFSYDFNFDVFISFRGTDTRFGFTGNLNKALSDKGIRTFIDDKELQKGDEITPSLLKRIEESRIAIIVFSKEYASSSFCLDELVHIIHYFKEKGRLVLPVFYDVEPSHVRHQNYSYGEALAKHEERFQKSKKNMERVLKWKIALNKVADLSGYHFNLGYPSSF